MSGPLDTVYRWIQASTGIVEQDAATLTTGRLICLMGGFAATVAYKLAKGVDQEPFPGGEFPVLPVPSWNADDAPNPPGQAAQGEEAVSASKILRAIFGGLSGGFGTFFNSAADIMPLIPMKKEHPYATILFALGNAFFNATMGTFLAFPPLNGKSFSEDKHASIGFAFAGFCAASCWSTIALKYLEMQGQAPAGLVDTPAFKNLGLPKLGPIPAVPVSVGRSMMLIISVSRTICAALDNPPNAYAQAQIALQAIPGLTEILRLGIKTGPGGGVS